MEKFYVITNKEYLEAVKRFKQLEIKQGEFIKKFMEENNIDGNMYSLGGDGSMNQPFEDYEKNNIRLEIEYTESNIERFGKEMLSTRTMYPDCILVGLRKNSKTNMALQQKCIDEQIPINLWRPRVGNYFKKLELGGYRHKQFDYEGKRYLMIESDKLTEDDFSEGFEEINGSEYYLMLEKAEAKGRN